MFSVKSPILKKEPRKIIGQNIRMLHGKELDVNLELVRDTENGTSKLTFGAHALIFPPS